MTQPSGTMLFPLENNRDLLRQGECLDVFRIISSKMFKIVCLIQNMKHLKNVKSICGFSCLFTKLLPDPKRSSSVYQWDQK